MARLARFPRAVGRGLAGARDAMTASTRTRLVVSALCAILVLVALALIWPALPCQVPGGDACSPEDDAEELVPADALAYVHLEVDPDSDQFAAAADTANELPALSRQITERVLAQVPGPGGQPADFERDLAPWFGGQAAVAFVPRGRAAEQVQLLEEGDADGAAEYAAGIAAGKATTTSYDGVEVTTSEGGVATASVEGFRVIGTEAGVQSVIDASTGAGGAQALIEDSLADELRDELPPERFVTAYISEEGVRRLIASPASPLASLEPFVDASASRGAAVSLGAGEESLELAVRSLLDPDASEEDPGFFAAFPAFEPNLPETLGPDTLAYMGIADPASTVSGLLAQATAEAPALARGFAAIADRLTQLAEVNLEKELLATLGGEAAIALQPGAGAAKEAKEADSQVPEGLPSGQPALATGQGSVPILQFLADEVDTQDARVALARLQGPLSESLDLGVELEPPRFERREVGGVEVQVLRVTTALNLAYALDGGRLAVATQPAGVEQVIAGEGGLDEAGSYRAATEDLASGDEVSMLIYLDLAGLIDLGEQQGLAESPGYAAFARDLGRLDAAGLAVEASEAAIATDLRLAIDASQGEDQASGG